MTQIFHITHVNNLQGIIATGGLLCDRRSQSVAHVRIGHQHIKDRRLKRAVPLIPGGTLGDYVPFYFAPRSPMLFAIHCGQVQGYARGQSEVVHLVSTAEAVDNLGLSWLFTDGHAEIHFTGFFDNLRNLDKIDWEIMRARYWNDTNDDPDRKRRRQAEFLVHDFFPWELVAGIGVYGQRTALAVEEALASSDHNPAVSIERNWYY
jgi:hypothetical protein